MADRVVTQDIPFGDPGRGIFAYRVGDRISSQAVTENGWQEYVSTPSSKSGKQAVADATGEEN